MDALVSLRSAKLALECCLELPRLFLDPSSLLPISLAVYRLSLDPSWWMASSLRLSALACVTPAGLAAPMRWVSDMVLLSSG